MSRGSRVRMEHYASMKLQAEKLRIISDPISGQ